MPTIHLETFMLAPVESCFDLARNIDALFLKSYVTRFLIAHNGDI